MQASLDYMFARGITLQGVRSGRSVSSGGSNGPLLSIRLGGRPTELADWRAGGSH
eukprot:CAMPEP_0119377490 /NCGR_PEP_ID=MMETSP1334-20130426/45191_1 /TAXON_ID=127549 /ORGANISM="Calcidiscus leptoporus, Strain RCC1130" /LENGTH=54 /DNA_ID=CAMNT_0007396433 /DNA_START=8 /DNA_END=173 /DNA_ORIENTATION=+